MPRLESRLDLPPWEVALLEGGPSLEEQAIAEGAPGQAHEEPGEAVVALKDSLGDSPAPGSSEPIREEGEVPLGDHRSSPHDGPQLLRGNVQAHPPPSKVLPFVGREPGGRRPAGGHGPASVLSNT